MGRFNRTIFENCTVLTAFTDSVYSIAITRDAYKYFYYGYTAWIISDLVSFVIAKRDPFFLLKYPGQVTAVHDGHCEN